MAGVVADGPLPGDRWALQRLHDAFGASLDAPMQAIGDATNTVVLVAVALVVVLVLLLRGRARDAGLFLLAFGVVVALNPILKAVVDRARPDIRPLPESVSDLAFPSGHASGTAAFVGAVLLVVPRGRWRAVVVVVGLVFLAVVGFSRLALSVHHPSDVVAGWLWAGAWVALLASLAGSRR